MVVIQDWQSRCWLQAPGLSLQPQLGTAVIKAIFGDGRKHELLLSTYQMCILLLFNSADRLSFKQIQSATGIPSAALKRCLQSLACESGKDVLKKEPTSKEIKRRDSFSFNSGFTCKCYKVNMRNDSISLAKMKSVEKKVVKKVVQDRKLVIKAAIAKIMKSEKELDHKSLVSEVIKQLQPRFSANPSDIEEGIKSLIERDYIERKGSAVYKYLP